MTKHDLEAAENTRELERKDRQFREYENPGDEIRQALTVVALEVDAIGRSHNPGGDDRQTSGDAIRASVERIRKVCERGIVWRASAFEDVSAEDRKAARKAVEELYAILCGVPRMSRADFARATREYQRAMGFKVSEP